MYICKVKNWQLVQPEVIACLQQNHSAAGQKLPVPSSGCLYRDDTTVGNFLYGKDHKLTGKSDLKKY